MRQKRVYLSDLLAQYAATPDACWPWTGCLNNRGYGTTNRGPRGAAKGWAIHRLVWTMLVGPIPEHLELDHLCRNKACFNPRHLEPVTPRVNMLRGDTLAAKNAAKTHCPQGHAYSPENTYREKGGARKCRTCCVERARRYRERKAA